MSDLPQTSQTSPGPLGSPSTTPHPYFSRANSSNSNLDSPGRLSIASNLPSHLSRSLRSASQLALDRLQRNLDSAHHIRHLSLPKERTSIIDNATARHSSKQIIQIALKKWIFVFFSVQGVISSGSLAFALLRKKRAAKRGEARALSKVIIAELVNVTTLRLATFLASYSALWTLTYPALLKLAEKPVQDRYQLTTNVTHDKSPSKRQSLTHKLTRFVSTWAASIAGGVAGLALLAQTKDERVNLAPNLLCRGLYTLAKHRPLINLAYGDLLLFAVSNAQIMSAFVISPGTLPSWYWHWIRRVGTLDVQFLLLQGRLSRNQLSDMTLIQHVVDRTNPRSVGNERRLQAWLSTPHPFKWPHAPCHLNHPMIDNCLLANLHRAGIAFKSMLPTYAILHLIPALLFRSRVFMKSPIMFLYSIMKKSVSSALFLGTFVWIILHSLCIPSRLYDWRCWTIQGSPNHAIAGFATALALLWEDPRRRGELALYCAPKAITSAWGVLKAKKLVKSLAYGEMALASAGTAMLMHCFIHAPEQMPSLIRGIISQLVDPHAPGRSSHSTPQVPITPVEQSPSPADEEEAELTIKLEG